MAIYRQCRFSLAITEASDPQVTFLEDCCEHFEGYVIKDDLVTAYNDYAKKNGLPSAPSEKGFGQFIRDQTIIPMIEYFPVVKDRRPEAWHGILKKKL